MKETDNALTNLSQEDTSFTSDTTTSDFQQPPDLDKKELADALASARKALLALQKKDGHWCFPLEADCTIPAEYVLMMHFMDDIDTGLEIKLARFIRTKQDTEHGGWPLYYGGHFDLSCTVKAYYALKLSLIHI